MTTSLELAIVAIRSGRREEGRQLLNLLIQQNPNNEMAWLWMSSVVNNDEQRARCLYHVLAINPENVLARRGLGVLGIVVSDSRPVKVPRDSQPIIIPKPLTPPQAGPLKALPEPQPAAARRPFRIDPQTIVQELPFTPIKPPFSKPVQVVTAVNPSPALPSQPQPAPAAPMSPPIQQPAQPLPGVQTRTEAPAAFPANQPAAAAQPQAQTPPQGETQKLQHPSEPVPVVPPPNVQLNLMGMPAADQQAKPDTGPMPSPPSQPGQPYPSLSDTGPMGGSGQYPGAGPMSTTETRPTQPLPAPHSNATVGMPYPAQSQMQQPAAPMSPLHSNVTMGMPNQQYPQPPYSYPAAAVHAQPTMGMAQPTYGTPPGQINGYSVHPSEPVPVVYANTAMGMPYPVFGPNSPQMAGPALHSSSTMPMPTGQPGLVDYRALSAAGLLPRQKSGRPVRREEEEEDGEQLNLLAVIIFGSLSVTALGGLGMLILLMFTGN